MKSALTTQSNQSAQTNGGYSNLRLRRAMPELRDLANSLALTTASPDLVALAASIALLWVHGGCK